MILDEATSSIDTETEAIIQKAIKRVLVGRTAIIIAHRLSTIVDSDRILLMDQGIIKEDGSHAELMRQHAGYYKLYMNQFQDLQVDAQIDTFEKQLKDI
jgi:ATP-binding cassette subfamily B protein